MPKYKVAHSYRSNHNGRTFAYDKGTEVEVDEQVAAWVNRDSPGTLVAPRGGKSKGGGKVGNSEDAPDGANPDGQGADGGDD